MSTSEDKRVLADIIDAVIVEEKSNNEWNKKKHKDITKDLSTEVKPADKVTSAGEQSSELIKSIIEGEDKLSVRKKVSRMLKRGDPLVEGKATMVILARREMTKLLTTMDALDKVESLVLEKVLSGGYDESPDYELGSLIKLLEGTLSRGLTIVEKVLGSPDYEEFLLAFRDSEDDKDLENVASIAHDKESRDKLRRLAHAIKSEISKKTGDTDE